MEFNINEDIEIAPPLFKPEILAPAGDISSFLSALAAGADATYVGLKNFSARAGADNFSMTDLSRMVNLANSENRKVYIAFNSLVKPSDLPAVGNLMKRLARDAKPNALIIQDIGIIDIARQAGFEGEIHLSTLANLTHSKALESAKELGADRVVIPRELNIDEIRDLAKLCPEGMSLELFIHGALCYCVSGRCYWSSYMGGKSGLRGRCVQPCRRVYQQRSREGRYFSSQDLSLDILVKSLLSIEKLSSWKIEGRKKGPHYVYHTVTAYKLLRDEGSSAKKEAQGLLDMAFGRPRTHGIFLPQTPQSILAPNDSTSSGLLVGKIQFELPKELPKRTRKGDKTPPPSPKPYMKPRIPLLPKDLLRIGFEDDRWYATVPVTQQVPKAGSYFLRLDKHKTPKAGTPIFLIDRREEDLIHELKKWNTMLQKCPAKSSTEVNFSPQFPIKGVREKFTNIHVRASLPQGKETRAARSNITGLWMTRGTVRATSRTVAPRISWWLPPVIWPSEEQNWERLIAETLRNGARHFVCNAPWQIKFFEKYLPKNNTPELEEKPGKRRLPRLSLIAGPFCNVANIATISVLQQMGFGAVIVSPELAKEDFLVLPRQASLPLGFILQGFWPVGISRHTDNHIKQNTLFDSPKKEQFWTHQYGQNLWIYPAWPVDFNEHKATLQSAGYSFFIQLDEHAPETKKRESGDFNWNNTLL